MMQCLPLPFPSCSPSGRSGGCDRFSLLSFGFEDRSQWRPAFPRRALCFPCQKAPAPAWMRVKILSGYLCPHRCHLSVALQIQLLFRGGSAGFAVVRQLWTREGPTHPPGTLTLQTKVPYRGTAQPRLPPQGPGIPVALPEVQVGRDLGGLRPAGRRGYLPQPRCQPVPAGDPPPAQPGQLGSQAVSKLVDWPGAGTHHPRDRGTCGTEGSDPPATRPGPFRSQPSGNHFVQPPEAEIFFKKKSINYFPFSSDPTFVFSPQLPVGDSLTSGKS